ncbi:MAG: hypothetical protein IPO50_11915 [Sphingomonadales bacterium]|nr:hypothetical protein [Sphingomonadales bacterium]
MAICRWQAIYGSNPQYLQGQFQRHGGHRQPMSPVYNQYRRLEGDPTHDPAREAQRMIFQPCSAPAPDRANVCEGKLVRRGPRHDKRIFKDVAALAHVARANCPQIRRIFGLTSAWEL